VLILEMIRGIHARAASAAVGANARRFEDPLSKLRDQQILSGTISAHRRETRRPAATSPSRVGR
jgi:hypothetical protein